MQAARFILAAILSLSSHAVLAQPIELPVAKPSESTKLDAFGDPLPPGALARYGTIRLRHDAKAVAFLDNNTIVSVGSSIRFWDAATGRLIREHRHEKMVNPSTAAISADRKRVVVCHTDRFYRIWDIEAGHLIEEIEGKSDLAVSLEIFRPPVSVAADGSRFTVTEYRLGNHRIVFSRWMVYSSNSKTAPIYLPVEIHNPSVISADGRRVATAITVNTGSAGQTLQIWDVASRERIRNDKIDAGNSVHVQFMPDGKALAVVGEERYALRSIDGAEIWSQPSDAERLDIACVTANRLVLLATKAESNVTEVRAVDAANGRRLRHWLVPGMVEAGSVSPDGNRLVIASKTRLHVLNLTDGKELTSAPGHSGVIYAARVTHDGRYVASADALDKDVILWDISTSRPIRRFQGHTEGALSIDLSPDGKLIAASSLDGSVLIWDISTGRLRFEAARFDRPVWRLGFLADNHGLAAAKEEELRYQVIDYARGQVVREMPIGMFQKPCAMWSLPNGRFLTVFATAIGFPEGSIHRNPKGIDIWDVNGGRLFRHLDDFSWQSLHCALSPDLRTLCATGKDGRICLWEVATGQQRLVLKATESMIDNLGWSQVLGCSPDGLTIACVHQSATRIDFWDIPSGKRFGGVNAPGHAINSFDFTPDGRRLLTGGRDSTILCWDMTRPEWRSRQLVSRLSDADLAQHWARLRNGKADEAYRSKWALAGDAKKTVEFFRTRLPSTPPISAERIKSWIADLDSQQYTVRERAQSDLQDHFGECEESLRNALVGSITAEAKNRVNRIIEANFAAIPKPDQLRDLRAIEILEQIGTPEARDLLRHLAAVESPTRFSRDAAESLKRLESK